MTFRSFRSLSVVVVAGVVGLTVLACSNTTVEVYPGTDGGNATPASICSELSSLPCATPTDTCINDIKAGINTCTGGADAKQALLNCLAAAHYDCSGGAPTTHDCSNQLIAAGCSSVPGSSLDAGLADTGNPGMVDAADAAQATGICSGLCQNGVPMTFSCTSNQGAFTIQMDVGASNCPNYAKVGTPVCLATQTTFNSWVNFQNTEIDCDGTVRGSGSDPCPTIGTWSLQGNTLNLDLTSQQIVASCTKQ